MTRWYYENEDKIKNMIENGFSQSEIAKVFGVHEETVRRYCKANNIKTWGYKTSGFIGKKQGMLTYIERIGVDKDRSVIWKCQCECGNFINITRNSRKENCGCVKSIREQLNISCNDRLYRIWQSMKGRCKYPSVNDYDKYGGRGITVCEEWINRDNGFENFCLWAVKNGYKDDLTIDRIDVDGNYEPNNCRWATTKEQGRNKSNNRFLDYKGEVKCLAEWAEIYGISSDTLSARLDKYMWDLDKALNTPVRKRKDNRSGEYNYK